MRKLEVQHHSPEQVRGYIDTAERMLQELGYDDAERVALLPTILTLLASKSVSLIEDGAGVVPALEIPRARH